MYVSIQSLTLLSSWSPLQTNTATRLHRSDSASVSLSSPELHQTQPVPEPLLPESGPIPGRAGQRELLARGFRLRGQTGGTGVQEAAAARRRLLQDAVRTSVLQVSSLPAVVSLAL